MGNTVFSGNALIDNSLPGGILDATVLALSARFGSNLVVGTTGAGAFRSAFGKAVDLGCNVFWENDGPHVTGIPGHPTDVEADPQFCDPESDDYRVHATSPCLPENSPEGCGVIADREVGCGMISIEPRTWARTKALHRTGD